MHASTTAQQRAYQQWREAVRTAHQQGVGLHRPWRDAFANFLRDMGEPPDKAKLKRRDPDYGFTPDNCEWGG